jgi:hypothetical protein
MPSGSRLCCGARPASRASCTGTARSARAAGGSTRAGFLDQYPRGSATTSPALTDGQAFELRLPQPVEVYGIRIVGRAGGEYASCAELSAYG